MENENQVEIQNTTVSLIVGNRLKKTLGLIVSVHKKVDYNVENRSKYDFKS
jgi:hypothetical protein